MKRKSKNISKVINSKINKNIKTNTNSTITKFPIERKEIEEEKVAEVSPLNVLYEEDREDDFKIRNHKINENTNINKIDYNKMIFAEITDGTPIINILYVDLKLSNMILMNVTKLTDIHPLGVRIGFREYIKGYPLNAIKIDKKEKVKFIEALQKSINSYSKIDPNYLPNMSKSLKEFTKEAMGK